MATNPQDLLSYVGMLYSQLHLQHPREVPLLVAALRVWTQYRRLINGLIVMLQKVLLKLRSGIRLAYGGCSMETLAKE